MNTYSSDFEAGELTQVTQSRRGRSKNGSVARLTLGLIAGVFLVPITAGAEPLVDDSQIPRLEVSESVEVSESADVSKSLDVSQSGAVSQSESERVSRSERVSESESVSTPEQASNSNQIIDLRPSQKSEQTTDRSTHRSTSITVTDQVRANSQSEETDFNQLITKVDSFISSYESNLETRGIDQTVGDGTQLRVQLVEYCAKANIEDSGKEKLCETTRRNLDNKLASSKPPR